MDFIWLYFDLIPSLDLPGAGFHNDNLNWIKFLNWNFCCGTGHKVIFFLDAKTTDSSGEEDSDDEETNGNFQVIKHIS